MTIEWTCLEDGARASLNGQQRLVIRGGEEDNKSLGDVGIVSSVTVKGAQNRGGWTSVLPHVRECKRVLDTGFLARGFRIPGTGFHPLSVKVGFWIQSLVGFRIHLAVFQIPKPLKIPNSASTIFSDSVFRILILLGAKSCTCRGFLCHSACRSRVSESKQASMQASKQLYYTQKKYILHAHTYILAKAIRGRQCGDAVYWP